MLIFKVIAFTFRKQTIFKMNHNKSTRETIVFNCFQKNFILLLKEHMPFDSTWLLNNNFAEAQNPRSVYVFIGEV